MIVTYIIIGISVLLLYLYIGFNIFHQVSRDRMISDNLALYFYVAYIVLFIVVVNGFIMITFHERIKKKTGPPGSLGVQGNRGKRGISGKCETSCLDQKCHIDLMTIIQKKYNELLAKEDKNSINIILDTSDPLTGQIVNKQMKNKILNNMIENICDSKQIKAAILKKNPDDVNKYIATIFEEWISLIYNALPKQNKHFQNKETNFFLNPDANNNNQKWNNDDNPFKKIEKYDIYNWGAGRIFKPLNIKIDSDPNSVNYLPIDSKPPLKLLYSNNYEFIYDNELNNSDHKDYSKNVKKYPNNSVSIWNNKEPINYRKETYYPIGNLVIGPDKSHLQTTEKEIDDPEEKYYKEKVFKYSGKKEGGELSFKGPAKKTVLVSGDVVEPEDYYSLWNNKNSYERNNVSIWRPKCPLGYESMSDVAVSGFNKPTSSNIKCVPKVCLEPNDNKKQTLFTTFDNKKIMGYSLNNNNENPSDVNGYNMYRFDNKEEKPLYKINEDCLTNKKAKTKPVEEMYSRIGLGWNGRPLRDPKYSVFNYLVQMPEAIISSKATNYKYYIIHTQLFNSNNKPDANFKTSSKNLYYVLVLNYLNNKYDRCLSTDGKENIIRTKIRNEKQSYWEIEPTKIEGEIRLKSANTGKYLRHARNPNLRKDIVKMRVFESQTTNKNDDSAIFVNIKSSFGTNYKTALEDDIPRKEEKFYLNKNNKLNISKDNYEYPLRGIRKNKIKSV
jgi:hypothetical protein